jgi:cellobiose phosphorylase
MGSGDWNDGMNRVGVEGKGESVWLGWFLCTVLQGFMPLCDRTLARSPATVSTGAKRRVAGELKGSDGTLPRLS